MSKNINQVFIANPITTNLSTDLMYFGRSPYGATDDAGMSYANFSAQFTLKTLTSAHIFVGNGSNVATDVALSGDATIANTGAITVASIGGKAVSLANSFTTSGNFTVIQTYTGATNVTFPTTGTLATTSQLATPAALTKADDTNVTLTLGGTPGTALLQATSITAGWNGLLGLTRGGTAASLTASTGGIVYSGASALAILSGTATANLPLLSGATASPTWGSFALSLGGGLTTAGALTTVGAFAATFTFTNTTSVTFPTAGTLATTSQLATPAALTKTDDTNVTLTLGGTPATALLQATSITVGWSGTLGVARGGTGLAAITAHDLVIGNGTSAATLLAPSATSGVPLISQGASADPAYGTAVVAGGGTGAVTFTAFSVLCAGTTATGAFQNVSGLGSSGQVLTSAGAGAIPAWATPATGGVVKNNVTGTSASMAINNLYVANNVALVTVTLPSTAAVGDQVFVRGSGSGGWLIAQNASGIIHVGSSASTTGVGGSVASSNRYDCIELTCIVANNEWVSCSIQGNLTVV